MLKKEKWNLLYYVSLVYTFIPLVTTYNTSYFIPVVIITVLFDICYIWIIYTSRQWCEILCWLYIVCYITYYASMINVNMSMFLFFQTNILTFRFPNDSYKSWKWLILYAEIGIIYLFNLPKITFLDAIVLLIIHSFAIGLAISLKYTIRITKEKDTQLESVNLLFAENDRNRIRRDLHDTLGHVFAMLSVKSELALTLLDKQDYAKVKKELEDIMNVSRSSMEEVRHIVQQTQLINIYDELHILQHVLESYNIKCTIENKQLTELLSLVQANEVSLMLRELVTNVLKHAHATRCSIRFEKQRERICIIIKDDGVGFRELTGQELQTVQDRVVILRGELTVVSLRRPTIIQLCIPMEE